MIKSFQELSQVLAVTGISITFSTAVKNLSTSPKVNEKTKPHQLHSPNNLQASTYHLFRTIDQAKESQTIFEREKSLAPKNEEFIACLSVAPICTQETAHPKEDNLHGMAEEDMQQDPNEEMDQDHYDYIEHWYQTATQERHNSPLQKILVSYHLQLLVFHAHVPIKVYISTMSMNVSLYLLCTSLHWKYSYT